MTSQHDNDVYTSARSIEESLLRAAWRWAQDRSKDPEVKVGAVVYDHETGASIFGYNGFNRGMPDLKSVWDNADRNDPTGKHAFVRHAEPNAIEKAWKLLGDISDCILVVTRMPCPACMKDWIVPSGIKSVFYSDHRKGSEASVGMARQHGISFTQLSSPGVGELYSGPLCEPHTPSVSPAASRRVFIEPEVVDELRGHFPGVVSGTDADVIRLLIGMYHNAYEHHSDSSNRSTRLAEFRGTPFHIALSCVDDGYKIRVVHVDPR